MFFKYLKNLFAAAFLLFTLMSVLATSASRDDAHPTSGSLYIISDCVTPTLDANISISNGTIVSPGGLTFTNFGFPVAVLSQTMTGIVGVATRECTVTYGEDGYNNVENRWLYSCYDNGRFTCSIYIGPNY